MPTLAIALMKKKHPEMKGPPDPADEPPAMDGPDSAEAPPSDEGIACAHDLMQAVKMGDAVGVYHAVQDLVNEIQGGGEPEAPEAPGEPPPEEEPPPAAA